MPRRAVPARFMSKACSKNFAEASGSSTMTAMCRSLDMGVPFYCCAMMRRTPSARNPPRSVVDRVDVMVGIDHRLDHGRPLGRQRRRHGGLQRRGAAHAERGYAEIMRRRLGVVLGLELGAVERKLAADLL